MSIFARIATAFQAFFLALFKKETSERIALAIEGKETPKLAAPDKKEKKPAPKPKPKPPERSDAVNLVAALQREARFVDFLKEELDAYSDEQVGAAARDVHRGCAEVFERFFAIAPLMSQEENSAVDIPADFDPGLFHLTGNVAGDGPYQGSLAHHGWKTTKCEIPKWSGSKKAASVVAPAEVELG